MSALRVVSGMRTTGCLHLGHYHGVLKNWIKLQHEYECFFFAADYHALTTEYADPSKLAEHTKEMVIDWLAVGIDPNLAAVFVQSDVLEHAELHLLLSMMTPLSWLERVPTYKDQMQKLKDRELSTYGFLGYPLLQAADVMLYHGSYVPVGEDQVPHIELIREIARRFNYLYGREKDYEKRAHDAIKKLGKKQGYLYKSLLKAYQEQGDQASLEKGQALLQAHPNLSIGDKERLLGYLEGGGKMILTEPQPLLTEIPLFPGLDGQKMSKSYGNVITLRESEASVSQKIRTMPTDPARVRRNDPGDPEKCPVWAYHKIYSDDKTKAWVQKECKSAGIGCVDCKQCVMDSINGELAPIREKAAEYQKNSDLIDSVLVQGAMKAKDIARDTMKDVKKVMGIGD